MRAFSNPASRAVLAVAFLSLGACQTAPKVTDDSIAELSPSQRSKGASDAILGSVGWKRRDGGTWFERQRVPDWKFEVHNASVVTSSASVERRLGELGVTVSKIAEAKLKAGYSASSQYKLTTVQIKDPFVLAEHIESSFKTDPRLRELLAMQDIRLVTSITTILDSRLTSQVEGSIGAKGTVTKLPTTNDVAISVEVGGKKQYEIKVGDGTTVLYRFSRFCWSPAGRLVTLRVDGEGTDTCPAGTVDRLPT